MSEHVEKKPQLVAKLDTLENKLQSMADYEVQLRNCIDRLVGPELVPVGEPFDWNHTSIYERLDLMIGLAEEFNTRLAVQSERLILSLGHDD